MLPLSLFGEGTNKGNTPAAKEKVLPLELVYINRAMIRSKWNRGIESHNHLLTKSTISQGIKQTQGIV